MERPECLAKGHLRNTLKKGCWEIVYFRFLILLDTIFKSFPEPILLLLHPSSLPSPLHFLSLCFSHLPLVVTHQECVSEDVEAAPAQSSEGLLFFLTLNPLKVFILSSSLVCLCKQQNTPLSYSIGFYFFWPNDSCHGAELNIKALTDPRCNRAFIIQLSNPRSSLSPLYGESAPKAKSLSQFTRRPGHHYFVHAGVRNHQGHNISRWEGEQNTSCVQTQALTLKVWFIYMFS